MSYYRILQNRVKNKQTTLFVTARVPGAKQPKCFKTMRATYDERDAKMLSDVGFGLMT